MRRGVRWAVSAVCLIAAALFGLAGIIIFKTVEAGEGEGGITLVSLDGSLTLSKAQHMLETELEQEEPVGFTAWEEESDQRITDGEGLRSASASLLRIFGTSEYLLPYGKILQASDKEGCLIGEKTAQKLFGSGKAEGLMVLCGGRELVIRGVIKEPEEILVFQETEKGAVFERITLEAVSGEKGTKKDTAAEKFQNRHDLNGMVPQKTGTSPLETALSLVPGKWSDFSGWSVNIKHFRQEKQRRQMLPKSILDVTAERHKRTAVCLLSGSLLALLLGMAVNTSKERKPYGKCEKSPRMGERIGGK